MKRFGIGAPVLLAILLGVYAARADATSCRVRFSLSGWSVFYQTAHGHGTVMCDNGQSRRVFIRVKGGGPTVGETKVFDGTGRFSPVGDIRELYGTYGMAEAHAGAGPSSAAQVVTKGSVSLALAGTGEGVNLGISFGKFVISPARAQRHAAR